MDLMPGGVCTKLETYFDGKRISHYMASIFYEQCSTTSTS